MRTLPIFASLLGGAAVYLVFAACGSGESRGRSRLGDSSTGGNAMTSSTVPDARAQGSADPETATEPCNKKFASPVIGGDVVYAEHLFLGRTAAQLARLVAIGTSPAARSSFPALTSWRPQRSSFKTERRRSTALSADRQPSTPWRSFYRNESRWPVGLRSRHRTARWRLPPAESDPKGGPVDFRA